NQTEDKLKFFWISFLFMVANIGLTSKTNINKNAFKDDFTYFTITLRPQIIKVVYALSLHHWTCQELR
ncbi:hypothetical protein, partial [Streptococcus pneumoniae]